jgi:hypothetical protein
VVHYSNLRSIIVLSFRGLPVCRYLFCCHSCSIPCPCKGLDFFLSTELDSLNALYWYI